MTTLSIATFSITGLVVSLSIIKNNNCSPSIKYHYAECRALIIMLSFVNLNVMALMNHDCKRFYSPGANRRNLRIFVIT
jgi:hypothetical protein